LQSATRRYLSFIDWEPCKPGGCGMSGIPVAANSTHAQCPANRVSNRSYQRERINVFVPPNIRHQLDVLRLEWRVTLAEAVRRVLSSGLRNIMLHAGSNPAPAVPLSKPP